MKLYYLPGACSFVPHVALEWIGKPYDAEAVNRQQLKSAAYLALNPQGAVPLLLDGDLAMSQNVAILSYLDEIYPEAELFGSRTPRDKAKARRWLSFFNADVHKTFVPFFRVPSYAEGNDALITQIRQDSQTQLLGYLAMANDYLENHTFFGEKISVADIYLYTMLGWANMLGIDFSHLRQLAPFIERVQANPGVASVREQEGLQR